MKIKGEHVNIDPHLLFQRQLTVRERCVMSHHTSLFQYELCTYPAALFESSSLSLQLNKAVLADYLWKSMKEEQRNPSGDVQYVLDGGALLHRVPWPRGSTYESVSHLYVMYVTQKYGGAAIVFDGYNDDPTTKDATHLRRTGYCVGVTAHFASGMMIKSKKDEFLNNKAKCRRSNRADSCRVCQAQRYSTDWRRHRLAGPSILHHAEMDAREVFLKSEPKKSTQQVTWSGCM